MDSRRFAILLTAHTSEYVIKTYGGLDSLYFRLLCDPGETWDTFSVIDGIFPSDEELQQYDGFVVTGSRRDAHDNGEWILELCQLLQKIQRKRKKLLGICFGHQIVCRALGGQTGRAPCGWEVGVKKLEIFDALRSKPYGVKLPSSLNIIEVHQDQVIEVPPGGELLAASEKTGVEMFAVGENVLGIQGHPEFTEDVFTNILDSCCSQGLMREEIASQAKASLKEGQPDREDLQRLCKSFLKGHSHCHYDPSKGA